MVALIEAGGEATIWVGRPEPIAQESALAGRLADAIAAEYVAVREEASASSSEPPSVRKRKLGRLRRELRRIRSRDYFPPPEGEQARAAVELLAENLEVVNT